MKPNPILLLVGGAKGAIGSTIAVATIVLDENPELIRPYLTINGQFSHSGPMRSMILAGWDINSTAMTDCLATHRVLPESLWKRYSDRPNRMDLRPAPMGQPDFKSQVNAIREDIAEFKKSFPEAIPVFVNLLPAAVENDLETCQDMDELYHDTVPDSFPDLAFTLAAILSKVPVINFSFNVVEIPALCRMASEKKFP